MASRDNLKASMGKGNEIPAQSREEFLAQKKVKETEIIEEGSSINNSVSPEVKEDIAQIPETSIEQKTTELIAESQYKVKKEKSAYTKKGYYALSEENYWYLKDITFYTDTQIQDYLNQLIEKDRENHLDILQNLPHSKKFL